ncbi:MAG: energy transducer TonB [bacterium]|nr:energy transducer TonB [bacterium]
MVKTVKDTKGKNLADVVMRVTTDGFAGVRLLAVYGGVVLLIIIWILGLILLGGAGTPVLIGFAAFMALLTIAYTYVFFLGKHMKIALTISFLIFGLAWGISAMPEDFGAGEGDVKMGGKMKLNVVKKSYDDLPPPPSIEVPMEAPTGLATEGTVGQVPLPVPDEEADADTIVDASPGVEDGVPDGSELVVDDMSEDEAMLAPTFDIEYSVAPSPAHLVKPKYPAMAKEMGIEGDVVLLVHIDSKGKVRNAIVQASPGLPEMEEAALTAAYKCTFKPAQQQGKPVGVWYTIVMEFQD